MVKTIILYTILLSVFCISGAGRALAQTPDGPPDLGTSEQYRVSPFYSVDYSVEPNGDTIPHIYMRPIVKYRRPVDMRRYARMVRNVKIVYPIAQYANQKLREMEARLDTIEDPREQERYVRQVERELKEQYTPILKQMSLSQGKILIKLIDRETGRTSYDLVKELRGNFSAFFWQGIARMFGANLKDSYDRDGEDRILEQIIVYYEAGLL